MSTDTQGNEPGVARSGRLVHWLSASLLLCLLSGCGDETPPAVQGEVTGGQDGAPTESAPEGWSPPASGAAEPVLSAEDAIAEVEQLLGQPGSLRSEAWGRAVRRVTQVLWPIATGESPPEAARTHEQLAQIAGSMAIELDKDPLLGESLEDDRKIEYEIHNTYRQLLEKAPAEFRTFFEAKGVALLRALAEARQKRFFGPK